MKKVIIIAFLIMTAMSLTGCKKSAVSDVPDKNTTQTEEYTQQESENPQPEGGYIPPDVEYNPSLTIISHVLSDYVGAEKYSEWLYGDSPQPKNLLTLIRDFEIPRDELEKLYYSTNMYYIYDYNFDLLYSGV